MDKVNEDYVVCKVCGERFKQITATHLKNKHGMTVDEYNEMYDYPLLVCKSISEKKSKNIKKTKNSKSYTAWNKGKTVSEKQKQKQSKTMKDKYSNGELQHWNLGNKLSETHKNKISESLMGHLYFDEDAKNKRNKTIQDKIDSGWVSPLKGKRLSEEHKQKAVSALKEINTKKQQEYHDLIVDKCDLENLKILSHDYYYYDLKCGKCGTNFQRTRQVFNESKNDGKDICPSCNPPTFISKGEIELSNYIKSIYDGDVILNDRIQLEGKEIDCYLPELNIGFEYCGLYWHSELYHDKKHLINKQKFALSKGIKIYTIYDTEWINQNEIVKSRVKSIVGKIDKRIYARNTTVKKIDSKISNKFLNENHLQGADKSGIRYGAFYGDKLLAVMTFNKGGFVKLKDGSYELNRFCMKLNHSVVGVASKLFKAFVREYSPENLISYANCRWSYGNLYKKMGFEFKSLSPPSPWYTNDFKTLKHRSNFMRHKLNIVDESVKTKDVIRSLGYYAVYDCGNSVWEYKKGE